MAGTSSLSEPHVLAHAKGRLFPDDAASDTYAVTDTQFATDEWLPGHPIPEDVRSRLEPFNHVRIGSGYPDLVGVRVPEQELLAVDRFGDEPPLIAVESKGYAGSTPPDIERGVVQAYNRLHEANAAYVAAPKGAISSTDRTLARELNVGVLGVEDGGAVLPLVVPRVVGNRTSDEATAIRFQASAQGVADKSFGLNHPKNYLAYPLAVYHEDDTPSILDRYVVSATESALTGAAFLGLVTERPDGTALTPLGDEVLRFALDRYGSVDAALAEFEQWKGSQQRFCSIAPQWGLVARRVIWAYPATQLLVEELQTMHVDGIENPSLIDLVEWMHVRHPSFTVELFLRGTTSVRSRVLDDDGALLKGELEDGEIYHSPTVFQLKAMLYHSGVLSERGAEPHRLDPDTDVWRLRNPVPIRRST